MGTTAKDILDSIKGNKSKDYDSILFEKTRASVMSSVIGAGVGLVYAYNRRKSLLLGAFIGSLIGGAVGYYFVTQKKEKDEPK